MRRVAGMRATHIFMAEVLEQLQLAVSTLGKDRSAERLHNLFDRNRLSGQLIARRAIGKRFRSASRTLAFCDARSQHTRRAQRHPCPPAAGPST